jgi:hypothetical protein
VSQRSLASLRSPVPGFAVSTVRSGFGAPRDGGAREHHVIDIFRPRGTPVLAAADGYVRLNETPRGGRVIWLRDARSGRNLYYAHLHDWAIESGATVKAGDVIGYVGNTGNAVTTPPHLHFGLYDRGPTDPAPSLQRDDPPPAAITAPVEALDSWMRGRRDGRAVRVIAATRDHYRVALPDGTVELLRARDLTAASTPLRTVTTSGAVRELPRADAPMIEAVDTPIRLAVIGQFAEFDLVRLPDDTVGWVKREGTASSPGSGAAARRNGAGAGG